MDDHRSLAAWLQAPHTSEDLRINVHGKDRAGRLRPCIVVVQYHSGAREASGSFDTQSGFRSTFVVTSLHQVLKVQVRQGRRSVLLHGFKHRPARVEGERHNDALWDLKGTNTMGVGETDIVGIPTLMDDALRRDLSSHTYRELQDATTVAAVRFTPQQDQPGVTKWCSTDMLGAYDDPSPEVNFLSLQALARRFVVLFQADTPTLRQEYNTIATIVGKWRRIPSTACPRSDFTRVLYDSRFDVLDGNPFAYYLEHRMARLPTPPHLVDGDHIKYAYPEGANIGSVERYKFRVWLSLRMYALHYEEALLCERPAIELDEILMEDIAQKLEMFQGITSMPEYRHDSGVKDCLECSEHYFDNRHIITE
jgi:hypothetical protein